MVLWSTNKLSTFIVYRMNKHENSLKKVNVVIADIMFFSSDPLLYGSCIIVNCN